MRTIRFLLVLLCGSCVLGACEQFEPQPQQKTTYYGMRETTQGVEFVVVDVLKGQSSVQASINRIRTLRPGVFSYDPTRDFLLLGTNLGITVMDVRNNELVRNLQDIDYVQYNAATDKICGLSWAADEGRWYYAHAHSGTGEVQRVAPLNAFTKVEGGGATFDHKRGRYIVSTDRGLLVLDAQTGTLLRTLQGVQNVQYNEHSGLLIGTKTAKPKMLVEIDVDALSIREIAEIQGVSAVYPGPTAYDAQSEYYLVNTNLGVTVVKATTGAVVSKFGNLSQIVVLNKWVEEIENGRSY